MNPANIQAVAANPGIVRPGASPAMMMGSPGGMMGGMMMGNPGASPQQMMSTTGFSSNSSSSTDSHQVRHAEGIAKSRDAIRQSIGADVI
jgi:hypothetical protein